VTGGKVPSLATLGEMARMFNMVAARLREDLKREVLPWDLSQACNGGLRSLGVSGGHQSRQITLTGLKWRPYFLQSKRTQTVISAALQQIEASGVVNVRNQVTKLLLKHVPKLTFEESELSRELLPCPDFAAWKMKRGWKRLKLPWETLEQPPLPAAVKAPKVSQVWSKKEGRYVERKAAAFGAGVRGGIEKMRERLAAKDKELFERLKKADPSFVPHCKVFGEVDGVMWITCSNVGCKLKCRSKEVDTRGRKRATRRSGDPDEPI